MVDELKPEEAASQGEPSDEGKTVDKSEGEISSAPSIEKKAAKFLFNGREYDSREKAEASFKEMQTAYQKMKAEREQEPAAPVIEPSEESPQIEDFSELFSAAAALPNQSFAPDPVAVQTAARQVVQGAQLAFLSAEKDSTMPYFKEVSGEVIKMLKSDPELNALVLVHRPEKAMKLAYAQAMTGKVEKLKTAEYKRGREETLRESTKPDLASAEGQLTAPPKKALKDMTLEEMQAVLPHHESMVI
ncbi:MAG: hypothetical protein V1850_06810 [Candidatus Bathyarchaeota archaeon]